MWVEMYERELYQSAAFTSRVTDVILTMLHAISEKVFDNVGFMDARDFLVIQGNRRSSVMEGNRHWHDR